MAIERNEPTVAAMRAAALTLRVFRVGEGEAVLFDGRMVVKRLIEPLGRTLLTYLAPEGLTLEAIVATRSPRDDLNALSTLLAGDDPPSLAPDAVLYHNGRRWAHGSRRPSGSGLRRCPRSGGWRWEP